MFKIKNNGRNILNKVFILMFVLLSMFLVGCKKEEEDKEFLDIVTTTTSYYAEGVMESMYTEGRKQNNFKVYYKSPDLIKVVLSDVDSDENQTILKNDKGIYVLIPKINKKFRIQSNWPTNASYPYLLSSLAKDIANMENPVKTETEDTITIETDTYLYKDAVANKQKIVFDRETCLPLEVLIYDSQGNLYIRVAFTKIDLEANISDDEFVVDDTMSTLRSIYTEEVIYEDRSIKYPIYVPEGCVLKTESSTSSTDGLEVLSIMTYSGTYNFTIIQQYLNDVKTTAYAQESGEILCFLGVPTIIKEHGIQAVFEGIEFTIASTDLNVEEMLNILASYMTITQEK